MPTLGRTLPRLVSLPATNSTNRYGAMPEVLSNHKAWSTKRHRVSQIRKCASEAGGELRFLQPEIPP
jgi:hypothetical protein